jgi:hypothetical protein
MSDLNEFRAALRATDPGLRPLDIPTIMQAGARVRRRRRLAVGTSSGFAVLALLIGGAQVTGAVGRAAPPVPDAAPGAAAAPSSPAATVMASRLQSSAPEPAPTDAGALGRVVATDLPAGGGTWVIHMKRIDNEQLPDITVGIMASRLLPSGELEPLYTANETEGSDRSPGFHAVSASQVIDDATMPAFGYYVGSAAKITGRAGGRTVTAQQARWSEDRNVVLFFFDPRSVPPGSDLTRLTAFDANGDRLPTGDATPAVG